MNNVVSKNVQPHRAQVSNAQNNVSARAVIKNEPQSETKVIRAYTDSPARSHYNNTESTVHQRSRLMDSEDSIKIKPKLSFKASLAMFKESRRQALMRDINNAAHTSAMNHAMLNKASHAALERKSLKDSKRTNQRLASYNTEAHERAGQALHLKKAMAHIAR